MIIKGDKCKDPPEESTIQKGTGTESNAQRKDLSKDLHKEDSLIVESKKCFEEAEDSPIEESKNLFEEGKQRILLELDALRRPIEAPSLLPQSDNPLAFGTMPSLVPLQDAVLAARGRGCTGEFSRPKAKKKGLVPRTQEK
jgi:hypothetical protein